MGNAENEVVVCNGPLRTKGESYWKMEKNSWDGRENILVVFWMKESSREGVSSFIGWNIRVGEKKINSISGKVVGAFEEMKVGNSGVLDEWGET